jgi:hypothetical protein
MSQNFLKIDKRILCWEIISFFAVFIIAFCVYVNDDSKDGTYPENEFGTLEEVKMILNPYLDIYNIHKEESNNLKSLEKVERFGFGFNSSNNKTSGSIVRNVYSGSAAGKAGLKEGDIIITANGLSILDDSQLSEIIDPKEKIELQIERGDQILNLSIAKSYFIGEEGFNVGSSHRVYPGNSSEYSVEGISILGALLIAFLWAITVLPVLIFGIILYKPLSKMHHKFYIVVINFIFIPIITGGTIFLLYLNPFFDEMVRNSINDSGYFFDFSVLMYPMLAIILSLFLIIGYTIALFAYKKYCHSEKNNLS